MSGIFAFFLDNALKIRTDDDDTASVSSSASESSGRRTCSFLFPDMAELER